MFDSESLKQRIGDLKKSVTLEPLKEVEEYFVDRLSQFGIEASYDVIANELPYFKTMNYTEYAHSFMIHPLNFELRERQILDAYLDDVSEILDYTGFFENKVLEGTANKYQEREPGDGLEPKNHLVVLSGSNILKKRICLNKLFFIAKKFKGDVWFKPHPLTTHQLIGELKDLFGEEAILHRNADMYYFLKEANVIHTSHLSESALYAASMGKEIDPIDVYQEARKSSFYHINRYLFIAEDPKRFINKTISSSKSGIINPLIDKNWKGKIDQYLDYMIKVRDSYKGHYVAKS